MNQSVLITGAGSGFGLGASIELARRGNAVIATAQTRTVYEDIKTMLQLSFVNTDYRAFARWPSYRALAWKDLRDKVGKPAHEAITQACHDRVAQLAAEGLPNPGKLSSRALLPSAESDAS